MTSGDQMDNAVRRSVTAQSDRVSAINHYLAVQRHERCQQVT